MSPASAGVTLLGIAEEYVDSNSSWSHVAIDIDDYVYGYKSAKRQSRKAKAKSIKLRAV